MRIDHTTREALDRLAAQTHISRAEVVRRLIVAANAETVFTGHFPTSAQIAQSLIEQLGANGKSVQFQPMMPIEEHKEQTP